MDLIQYQQASARTEKPMGVAARLRHARLGVLTELGEFASSAKKHLIYGKPLEGPILTNMHEELGDLPWYLMVVFNALDAEAESLQAVKGPTAGEPQDLDTCIGMLLDLSSRLWRMVDHYHTEPGEARRDLVQIAAHMVGIIQYHLCPVLELDFEDVLDANIAKLRERFPSAYSNEAALARADKGGLDSKES